MLAGLLLAAHCEASAQLYVGMPYGGGWQQDYHPYVGPIAVSRPLYYTPRYIGYRPWYGGYYGYPFGPWFGFATVIYPPPVYLYPVAIAPRAPAVQHCPDGSTIAVASYCPTVPAQEPAPLPAPAPEPGERG